VHRNASALTRGAHIGSYTQSATGPRWVTSTVYCYYYYRNYYYNCRCVLTRVPPTPTLPSTNTKQLDLAGKGSREMSDVNYPHTPDGGPGLGTAGFMPHSDPHQHRYSESYYNTLLNASSPPIPTSPPSYNDISLPPARFKISPREEEGKEQLPAYSCSLHREAIFQQKMELSSPFDRAGVRKWAKVYAVLHGTLLKLHKPKRISFFASRAPKGVDEREESGGSSGSNEIVGRRPAGYRPGELIGCYTLQLAEVGVAADYKK